jgi:hypothetical protein
MVFLFKAKQQTLKITFSVKRDTNICVIVVQVYFGFVCFE